MTANKRRAAPTDPSEPGEGTQGEESFYVGTGGVGGLSQALLGRSLPGERNACEIPALRTSLPSVVIARSALTAHADVRCCIFIRDSEYVCRAIPCYAMLTSMSDEVSFGRICRRQVLCVCLWQYRCISCYDTRYTSARFIPGARFIPTGWWLVVIHAM